MPTTQIEKTKKEKPQSFIASLWQIVTSTFSTSPTNYCAGDQCFRSPTFSSDSTSFTVDISPSDEDEIYSELYAAITEAASKGFLYAFLSVLAEEMVTDQLKKYHRHPDEIYWANQVVRTTVLLTLGANPIRTSALPFLTFLLPKFTNLSKSEANHLTTASIVTFDIVTNPVSLSVLASVFVSALAMSVIGGVSAKASYQVGVLIKNSLFKAKQQCESVEPTLKENLRLAN